MEVYPLETLTYGTYQFPHNPRKMEYLNRFRLAPQQRPGFGTLYQNIGFAGRLVRCEGELFAETAAAALLQLRALIEACSKSAPCMLKLPTGEQFSALPNQFGYTAQGDGRILSYRIEFMEVSAGNENLSTL